MLPVDFVTSNLSFLKLSLKSAGMQSLYYTHLLVGGLTGSVIISMLEVIKLSPFE